MYNLLKKPLYASILVVIIVASSVFIKLELRSYLINFHITEQQARWIGDIIINFSLFALFFYLIRKLSLEKLGGISNEKLKNKLLLLIPFLLLIPMSTELFDLNWSETNLLNLFILLLWSLSIGFFEESALRGFLQSVYLNKFWKSRMGIILSVFITSFIFGLLHLISWTGNLYSEINQVIIATILGVLFGALLLKTNKLYPIAIIHALFDFFSGIDELKPADNSVSNIVENNSVIQEFSVSFILIPFFIIGIILLIKIKLNELNLRDKLKDI
ncbi:CPBP family intramembrane glutamic endopeptidase [Pontimicrobium sp. SW4]|uniref:CPBP family intramembrane glutamic endopeptidase n=1 Tax=Pontimicrobium sp. SW4 TaxID=3153519 RepID=A0AAU7BW23_9FLAO